MERSKLWRSTFKTNQALLERNLGGYTDDLAARRPAPGSASPAWLMAHLIHARRGILALLGAPVTDDGGLGQDGSRGGDGETLHLPFSELVVLFQATDDLMKAAILAVEDWDRSVKNPGIGIEQPLEQALAFMHMHESYHIGQIGFCRKLLGLPGAI